MTSDPFPEGRGITDRDLVRLYWPVALRPAFDALFAIDDTLAAIVANSTQPALGAIRLAWWREALERLDTTPPPPEPRLQAAANDLLARGISGQRLAELEDGHATRLEEAPDPLRIAKGGERLFAIAADLLRAGDPMLDAAGRLYALGRAARSGATNASTGELLGGVEGHRFAKAVRPVTALARLAARDLTRRGAPEPEATPGRALALLAHWRSGKVA